MREGTFFIHYRKIRLENIGFGEKVLLLPQFGS